MKPLNQRRLLPAGFPAHCVGFDIRDLPAQPWQNGLGATREIAKGSMRPQPDDVDPGWDWRISLADLTSAAPFSRFEGVDRVAVLAGSSSVTLKGRSEAIVFEHRGDVHAFLGEEWLNAVLPSGRSTQLLNVMTRRGAAQATVEMTTTARLFQPDQAIGMLIVLCGTFSIGRDTYGGGLATVQFGQGGGMHWQGGLAAIQAKPSSPDACLAYVQIKPNTPAPSQ